MFLNSGALIRLVKLGNLQLTAKGVAAMFFEIFFGILTSIVIYFVINVFLEEYDQSNIYLYYVYCFIYLLLALLILIFRFLLIRIIFNLYFWNTLMIANVAMALLIGIYIYSKHAKEIKK